MTKPRHVLFAGCLIALSTIPGALRSEERFAFSSYRDIETLFEREGYTVKAWRAGNREISRLLLTHVPSRWRGQYAREVTVKTKKRMFFRILLPIVLRANEMILQDRHRLERLAGVASLEVDDQDWLANLAKLYRLDGVAANGSTLIERLAKRVDIIPPSIALSQAAEESGWGTSRFADLGNALFGQWSWGKGIKPAQQRDGLGDYRIAAFETPLQSIVAYMRNLNRHPAYAAFREARHRGRRNGQAVTGQMLVGTLSTYSERGEHYVASLRAIIRVNKLDPADAAYLGEDAPIHLVPVGAGSE